MVAEPSIRKARVTDAAEMRSCVHAAYAHYIRRIGKPPGPMLDCYSQVIREHRAFVSERGGRIVGVLVLVSKDGGMLLDNVAVHPDHQGQGIGRSLVAHAESEAREQGFSCLDLYTHALMSENIEMYERMGYVEIERRTERGYPRVYMRKTIVGE